VGVKLSLKYALCHAEINSADFLTSCVGEVKDFVFFFYISTVDSHNTALHLNTALCDRYNPSPTPIINYHSNSWHYRALGSRLLRFIPVPVLDSVHHSLSRIPILKGQSTLQLHDSDISAL